MERDDNLRLRPPRHRVDRRALGWWTLQSTLFALPLPLTFGILWATIPPTREFFMWATLISCLPGLLYMAVMPAWRYRVHRWEATDDAVYAASGWLWQQWRVVPLSRVQTVDTLRGPIQQMFGLSGVTVATASSSGAVKIKGIDHKVAEALVEYLAARVQAAPGDAT
ncbi:PH domain-containing protein [Streptomyces malaysiensis]|uniref:PH domain-containing protein n=1 Tax=Streptomyces malaysiensis subsp. samsunensis TaxID=459658 RepID=A0A9X2LYD3_STRMQ|nr:PH domain-containing protein [Streptomyces samsunensis]MCQ8832007.1 PH domain-containing protein [Streptomyces samsunensis]